MNVTRNAKDDGYTITVEVADADVANFEDRNMTLRQAVFHNATSQLGEILGKLNAAERADEEIARANEAKTIAESIDALPTSK